MPTQTNRRNTIYGYPNPQAGLQQEPIVQQRAPTTSDSAEIGAIWVDQPAQSFYILCDNTNGVNTWTSTTGGAELLTALTVTPGDITITDGDLNITLGDLFMAAASTATVGDLAAGDSVITGTLDVSAAATFGSTVHITGAVEMDSTLLVDGNVTVNGDFDLTSAAAISFHTTSNTNPAISFTTSGGAAETIDIFATLGTSPASINLVSTSGGVTIQGGLATADAINILSGAAGGIDMDYGTAGMTITGANGALGIVSGTGAIGISTDAAATTISIGTGAAVVKTIAIGGTGANVITIGNTQTAGSVNIGNAMTGGTITIGGTGLQTGTVSIAPGTGAQTIGIGTGGVGSKTINIGTGAVANIISIGNETGASSVTISGGTGSVNLDTPVGVYVFADNGLSITTAGRGLSLPGGVLVRSGAGSPNGAVAAPTGSIFLRTDPAGATSRAYINTDGAQAWTNITCAA